ncbi:MAG: sporulation protein YpjB [Gorillibacterium sp.]|nr:sporulation protein YpjB [Gorillibacterium sp.]
MIRKGTGKGKRLFAGLLIICMLGLVPACVRETKAPKGATVASSAEQAEIELLDQMVFEVYQMTEKGKVAEAREQLNRFGEAVTRTRFQGITGVDGIRTLTEATLTAQREYNRVTFSAADALAAVNSLRLITDAMAHPQDPMWHRYYKLIKEDIKQLEASAVEHKKQETEATFAELRKRYLTIRPALTIKKSMEDITKLDSLMVFIQGEISGNRLKTAEFMASLKAVEQGIDHLFERAEDSTAYLPLPDTDRPLVWTFGIGTILTVVLSFVAWRMFRFEKRISRVRKEKVDGKP